MNLRKKDEPVIKSLLEPWKMISKAYKSAYTQVITLLQFFISVMMINAELCGSMQVVITSATQGEVSIAQQQLSSKFTGEDSPVKISFHTSGVGLLASAVSLTQLALQRPALIIQAGIAGCFDDTVELGQVYVIGEEALADTGVEENGIWKDIFDLNLAQADGAPFNNKKLPNPWLPNYNLTGLPVVSSVTINEITTSRKRKEQVIEKYNPFIESMEGAALHYTCGLYNISFIQIRATSNYIGERDKAKWLMKEAIINLNKALIEYIDELVDKSVTTNHQLF